MQLMNCAYIRLSYASLFCHESVRPELANMALGPRSLRFLVRSIRHQFRERFQSQVDLGLLTIVGSMGSETSYF